MDFFTQNIISTLRKNAVKHAKKNAYVFLEEGERETARITFKELDQKARAIAAFLQSKNLFGQRIILLYPTGLEFISAFLGCLYAGVIAVPVNCPKLNEFEKYKADINIIAWNADIAGIFTLGDYLPAIKKSCNELISAKNIFVSDTSEIDIHRSVLYQKPQITDETIAYLQYSSGSTATPKASIILHKNLTHNLKYSGKIWDYSKKSVTFTWAPHSHVYGLVCGLLVPLYYGSTTYFMPSGAFIRKPLNWLRAISKYKVTHSGCPNFGYDLCIEEINENDLAGINLESWMVAVNGGENVQYETLLKFSQKFGPFGFCFNHFCSAYGMSEMAGTIAATQITKVPVFFNLSTEGLKNNKVIFTESNQEHSKFVSSGKLIPGLQAMIVDPEKRIALKPGNIGEIWLKGKPVTAGYWHNIDDTEEYFNAKLVGEDQFYFKTGDLGFIKEDEICITGRLKDVIVIFGKKYYPIDLVKTVAKTLSEFPISKNAVAFSQTVHDKEEIIFVQELLDNPATALFEEIINHIRKTIFDRFGIDLYGIILVNHNSLPKTPSGKLQKKLCQEHYLQNKLQVLKQHIKNQQTVEPEILQIAVAEHQEENKLKNQFIKLVSSVLKIDQNKINLSLPLSEYRLDSINIVRFTSSVNDVFQMDITPAALFEYATLENFFNALINKNNELPIAKLPPTKPVPEKKLSQESTDVAIIGMNGVFPGASDLESFWDNLVYGKNAITEIPKERWDFEKYLGDPAVDPNKTNIKWGGFIKNIAQFDASFFNISPREAELTDPQQRIFLQVVWKTIEDAGYSTDAIAKLKMGLFVGVFNNDYSELLQKNNITDAYTTTGTTHAILANRVSFLLNLNGPSEAIDTACSSSLVAIHHAVQAIQNGDCEVAIAGGVNALLTPTAYLAASKAGMLSAEGQCKTFDKNANGYVRAEGAGAILLKSLKSAIADGDHIYAVIKGTAVNHGGHVSSLTVPNPNAQAEVIVSAYRRANIPVETVGLIETHGTGTSLGDPIEINGLKKAFAILKAENKHSVVDKAQCALGAVKTHIGHLEAAAGIAGVIKVLLAMKHAKIPGNLNFEELNPYINLDQSPFYIANTTKQWTRFKNSENKEFPRRAGISSFGFGGTNAHIVLEEHVVEKNTDILPVPYPQLLTLSAKTDSALQQRLLDLSLWLSKQNEPISLSALSFTLNQGRNHFEKRAAFVVQSIQELRDSLKQIEQGTHPDHFVMYAKNHFDQNRPALRELYKSLIKEIQQPSQFSPVDYRSKLLAIADFYVNGYELDWSILHSGEKRKLSLPTYPFADEYYWIPNSHSDLVPKIKEKNNTQKKILISQTKKTVNITDHPLQQEMIQEIAKLLKIESSNINVTSSLSEIGFDSLAFKEFAAALENHYAIELNPAVFFTHNTVQLLTQYLLDNFSEKMGQLPQENTVIEEREFIQEQNEPIAIIGMQAYLPDSRNVTEFWEHLAAGDDLIKEIPTERWDWHKNYGDAKQDTSKTNSKWGGLLHEVDKFDAGFFNISSREANLMDPQHRLFLEIVWKTIEDAGYDPLSFSGKEVGVFAGVEFNEYQSLINAKQKIYHGHLATGNSHALIANRVSYFLNLQGPSEVIDTACSSALVAVHHAVSALRNGECTLAIAGGVSLMLNPDTFVITSQLGALSPDGECRTFDKSANGYVKGEGVGALLLKPLSQATADGDTIYGIIKGSAVNHGGKAQSLTAPNAATQSQLLYKSYRQANIDPRTVTYIEAHGTGTELGDPIEIEGLKQAFKMLLPNDTMVKKPFCGLGSVKTNIGHLEPASGIAGIIKVLLAMRYGKIPGNLHFKETNPYIDLKNTPFYILDKMQDWARLKDEKNNEIPRRAGVSSFGFGGTCAHVVIEENIAPLKISQLMPIKPYYLLTLSAKKEESLKQKMLELSEWIERHDSELNLEALSFTLNVGRSHFDLRCAMVVKTLDELKNTLGSLIKGQKPENTLQSSTQGNVKSPLFDEIYKSTLETLNNYAGLIPDIYREKLLVLADLYIKNYPIDWQVLHADEHHHRIPMLPTYPFLKQRCWFDMEFASASTEKSVKKIIRETITDINDLTHHYLQNIFAEKLNVAPENISVDETYEVYGVDSLIGLEITNRLEKDFGAIPKTILYERNTIRDLAEFLQQKYGEKLKTLFAGNEQVGEILEAVPSSEKIIESPVSQEIISDAEAIAIVGLSIRFPEANNLQEFWDNLVKGKNSVTEIPNDRWNYKDYPILLGGEEKYYKYGGFIQDVDKFDPLFFGIAPREAQLMDPQERLFMQTAWSTLEVAGYTREKLRVEANNQVGVFAGVTYNFYPLFIADEWNKGNRLPLDIQNFSVANRVSYFLNLKGPSYIVDTACSSSLAAIHLACESIHRGECRMAIAGGVNLSIHPAKYHFLGGYGFMSEKGECASFAEGGSGYVPGEGVGAVLLKPLSHAIRDNNHIYGVIKASAMNHGGKTSGYTVPNPNAQAELIKTALQKANMNPRTISYIEAHGTGTSLGDPIEVRGLQEAFENYTHDKQFCAIGSVKSNIGHLESAAGISQLAKVLMQLQHKKLVASIHSEKLNPFIDFQNTPFYVQRELTDWKSSNEHPRRAGISSFGAGGTNIHLIVEEYNASDKAIIKKPFMFLLSAMNKERLNEYADSMYSYLLAEESHYSKNNDIDIWLTKVCYTTQLGREPMPERLAIYAENYSNLKDNLKNYLDGKPSQQIFLTSNNATKMQNQSMSELFNKAQYEMILNHWVTGEMVPWHLFYEDIKLEMITLPTYPFAKRRCWVGLAPIKSQELEKEPRWLIFSDQELGLMLQNGLGRKNCVYGFAGDQFERMNDDTFYINPEIFDDYSHLLKDILAKYSLKGILYLWALEKSENTKKPLNLFQSLTEVKTFAPVYVVLRGQDNIEYNEIWQHHLWTFNEIMQNDKNNQQVMLLQLANKNLQQDAKIIINEINQYNPDKNHVIYQDKNRESQLLTNPEKFAHASAKSSTSPKLDIKITREELSDILLKLAAKLLQLAPEEIELDIAFLNYGMDSIIGINFVGEINKQFPDILAPMDLYRYPTVQQLAGYIYSCCQPETNTQTEPEQSVELPNEDDFMEKISHLSDDEVKKLLDDELKELDEI